MKSRKLAGLLFSIVLALFGPLAIAHAADSDTGQVALDEMRDRLALTPDQEARIAPLIQERNDRLKALRDSADPGASRREKLSQLRQARSIQQDFVKQVEPLLSKEQKKQWDALRKEMQENTKERLRERRGG